MRKEPIRKRKAQAKAMLEEVLEQIEALDLSARVVMKTQRGTDMMTLTALRNRKGKKLNYGKSFSFIYMKNRNITKSK